MENARGPYYQVPIPWAVSLLVFIVCLAVSIGVCIMGMELFSKSDFAVTRQFDEAIVFGVALVVCLGLACLLTGEVKSFIRRRSARKMVG